MSLFSPARDAVTTPYNSASPNGDGSTWRRRWWVITLHRHQGDGTGRGGQAVAAEWQTAMSPLCHRPGVSRLTRTSWGGFTAPEKKKTAAREGVDGHSCINVITWWWRWWRSYSVRESGWSCISTCSDFLSLLKVFSHLTKLDELCAISAEQTALATFS